MENFNKVFVGIDVGSSYTKLVGINENEKIIGFLVRKTGVSFENASKDCLKEFIDFKKINKNKILKFVSTGYGRDNVPYADSSYTEISCHARGCFYYFPFAIDIIDIGGQDNKIIKTEETGKIVSFKMNRKCAAGTGAFLEEMSLRLGIPLNNMNFLASTAKKIVKLGSFCTVFSATEILEKIRIGNSVNDIVKGIFNSILNRILEMDSFSNIIIMTGGVIAHNAYIVEMMKLLLSNKILIPKNPQITGALGAALYAKNSII